MNASLGPGGLPMNVRAIRLHQRFAVRRRVLAVRGRGRPVEGLLVDLSLHGCRIGGLGRHRFVLGGPIRVTLDGFAPLDGEVRWLGEGTVGVRFARPLGAGQLAGLLAVARDSLPERACA